MVWREMKQRWAQVTPLSLTICLTLILLSGLFSVYSVLSGGQDWYDMLSNTILFAAWHLPCDLVLTTALLSYPGPLKRIRITQRQTFIVNLLQILASAFLCAVVAVASATITDLIVNQPNAQRILQFMSLLLLRYFMMFTLVGLLVHCGWLLSDRKYLVCGLLLIGFVGVAMLATNTIQRDLFLFIVTSADGFSFSFSTISAVFAGMFILLGSISWWLSFSREEIGVQ